jgi:putative transposase
VEPKTIVRRRRLPHWDVPGAIYFVTTCLEGSIPAQGLLDLERYKAKLAQRPRPKQVSAEDWKIRQSKQLFARADEWMDKCLGARWFADSGLATIAVEATSQANATMFGPMS